MNLFTAKKLTDLRKHFSLSQEALAEKVGVSRQAISKWERGEASPDTDNLLALSKIYGISLDDLLGEKTAEEIIAEKNSKKQNEQIPEEQQEAEQKNTEDSKSSFYADEKNAPSEENTKSKEYREYGRKLLKFPYFIAALVIFLALGFASGKWHPTWMLFLTIPAYYITAWGFLAKTEKKMLLRFPVYLYAVILYLLMGFTASLWHPTWLIFLLIPVYYWYVGTKKY